MQGFHLAGGGTVTPSGHKEIRLYLVLFDGLKGRHKSLILIGIFRIFFSGRSQS